MRQPDLVKSVEITPQRRAYSATARKGGPGN
jgi:hypothetical protein